MVHLFFTLIMTYEIMNNKNKPLQTVFLRSSIQGTFFIQVDCETLNML
jgi:hypothetical protein